MIYVTGASGYLGQHLVKRGAIPLSRDDYSPCRAEVVIHAAWSGVPKTGEPVPDQSRNFSITQRLLDAYPRFIVFTSTRTGGGAYLEEKQAAEKYLSVSGIRHRIIRFPGLFGPPRRQGLMYAVTRATLLNRPITTTVAPDWTTMTVAAAAAVCMEAAYLERPGLAEARDEGTEAWLAFCRS